MKDFNTFTNVNAKESFPPLGGGLGGNKNFAFTLAEVLITLGVIGVVAAMTLPTVIKKYQQHVMLNKLKNTYSLVSKAINFAIKDYDEISADPQKVGCNSAVEVSKKYFEPYLKVIKKCDCSRSGECNFERGTMDGKPVTPEYEFTYYSYRAQNLFLADGSEILISRPPGDDGLIVIIVDINGNKKPNVYGKDVFRFKVEPNGQIKPLDLPIAHERSDILYHCQHTGRSCFNLIIYDGWKISDDYPW